MDLVEQIKLTTTMQDILDRYSPRIISHNRCPCPIHDGKNNNFQIYPQTNSFYCWTCKAGGDVIKFVSLLHKISYRDAIVKIDTDFNLCLFKKPTLTQYRKSQTKNKKRLAEANLKKVQHEYLKYGYRKLVDYRFWLLEQPKSIHQIHDLAYMDRLLDRFIDRDSIIPFEVDALVSALKLKFEEV